MGAAVGGQTVDLKNLGLGVYSETANPIQKNVSTKSSTSRSLTVEVSSLLLFSCFAAEQAADLLRRMMAYKAEDRLLPEEVLVHEWMTTVPAGS